MSASAAPEAVAEVRAVAEAAPAGEVVAAEAAETQLVIIIACSGLL